MRGAEMTGQDIAEGGAEMTFRGWLRGQRSRPDPVGDVARDMMADGRCWTGRDATSLIRHIRDDHDGYDLALQAVTRAAAEWAAISATDHDAAHLARRYRDVDGVTAHEPTP